MDDIIFKSEIFNIAIPNNVIQIFSKFKQDEKKKNESGGILLGYLIGDNIHISKVTIPNKFDKSSRYTFERNKDAAQIVVDHEFINSNGMIIYLGEWHTHPEDHPTPSGQDKIMIRDQYKKGKLNEPFLLLLIQGLVSLTVMVHDGGKLEFAKLISPYSDPA